MSGAVLLDRPVAKPHRVIFDAHDPDAQRRAHAEAFEFSLDSLHDLKLAPPLRRLSRARIQAMLRRGELAVDRSAGLIYPAKVRGGAQSRYIITPNASNAAVLIATTTSLKSLLQVASPSTQDVTVAFYSISFDGSAAGKPLTIELIEVNVAATVTSLTPAAFSDPNAPASLCVGGTSATGYNASAEGSVTVSRLLDSWLVPPTSGMLVQYAYGREPGVAISKFLRLRATGSAGVTPNAAVVVVAEE